MKPHHVEEPATEAEPNPPAKAENHRLKELRHIIDHAAHLLPHQGPIEVFVHQNTLEAFEDRPFHEAVRLGYETFGAQPYLPEPEYREMRDSGRIRIADLKAVLAEDLGTGGEDPINDLTSRFELRLAMLLHPLRSGPEAELRWVMAETDALTRFRPEIAPKLRERILESARQSLQKSAREKSSPLSHGSERRWEELTLRSLWAACQTGVKIAGLSQKSLERPIRPRDVLLAATGEDVDRYVHDTLIRFTSAFLDQGYADWNLPERDAGYFRSFLSVYRRPNRLAERWMQRLSRELQSLVPAQTTPLESIDESLRLLGIKEPEREPFITQSLLALEGWAGMVWQLENAASWVDRPAPKGSLIEFLAVRLILDRIAAEYQARESLGYHGPLHQLAKAAWELVPSTKDLSFQQAFLVFQVVQSLGWPPHVLEQFTPGDWRTLIHEMEEFDDLARRRVFHEAFERKYQHAALDAIAIHSTRRRENPPAKTRPSFQIVCCIDDREESFRRHLEEIDPACETFSAAGFFAVAMNYKGAADAHYKPLCPVILTPQHYVTEDVGYTFSGEHQRRAETRKALGRVTHEVHSGSRTFLGGILTGLFGSFAAFPLVARVLFPRLTSQIRRWCGAFVQPPPVTQLQLERYKPDPGPDNGHIGYSVTEMVTLVEKLLRDLGLTKNFSRLVVMTGHGSSSLNNPHESAYCCGACAGKRGGPNARAFAQMANDWRVRARLAMRGIEIPEDTAFLGSYHNTCDDSVIWYDLDRLPPSHHHDFEHAKLMVDEARLRNAHERCRRFQSASLKITPMDALRHVEQRAEDLSEVRPEYNHATNALCLVGQRGWSRGLFLDRRAFLNSYDPAEDDENGTVLLRILAAAIPVCAGISLEYYFSRVDNIHYGSGSKLPHNVASLLGVIEGASSDLRTGLYQQMVEIHEPLRCLFVIESTPEMMLGIMDRHEGIARLCRGDWVRLAVFDAQTSEIQVFKNGRFEIYQPGTDSLPTVDSSLTCYRGQRGNLDFATIQETPPTPSAH